MRLKAVQPALFPGVVEYSAANAYFLCTDGDCGVHQTAVVVVEILSETYTVRIHKAYILHAFPVVLSINKESKRAVVHL